MLWANDIKGVDYMKGYMVRTKKRTKRFRTVLLAMIMTMAFSVTALANKSPDTVFETDSDNILISQADTSIPDVDALMFGDDPAVVLGDKSLEGFSTLAVFSVTALDGYDFSDIETTEIRGASITSDMNVQLRFLPTDGLWESIGFELADGALYVEFPSEGQLAIFVKEEIEFGGEDDIINDPGVAPKTGDSLPVFVLMGVVALLGAGVSVYMLKRK